ncbi:MAG: hypothetical protein ABI051_12725 [Vicinamibacterales bacterium]
MRRLSGVVMLVTTGVMSVSFVVAREQRPLRLEALTVPPQRLPRGCRLATGPGFVGYPGVTKNPWIGTDATAATIRRVVDGSLHRSDRLSEVPAHSRDSEGVIGAYRAVYVPTKGSPIDVFAVRFTDPKLTVPASLSRLGNPARRVIVKGSTAIVVVPGSGGDCVRAVTDHIASLE